MSMGHVQSHQFASGPTPNRGGGGTNSQSYNTAGGAQFANQGGPAVQKRAQMHHHPGANSLLLPELIINKNKINFNGKQYRMHEGDQRVSNKQLKEAA